MWPLLAGAIIGKQDPAKAIFGNNEFGSEAGANVSPETGQNVSNQQTAARSFRSNLPGYVQGQANIDAEGTANEARADDKSINASSSKRGLLYSGLNQGAKAQNRSNLASGLMRRREQMNAAAEKAAQGYDMQGANAGLGMASLQQQAANQQYAGDKAGSKQNVGLIGGFLNGIG